MNLCWSKEAKSAENRLRKAVTPLYEAQARRELALAAQSKWIEYRKAQCAAVASLYQGGSMQSMQQNSCLVQLTDERIAAIQSMFP